MAFLPYRGSGIMLPFYLGICLWLVGYGFDKRTFEDSSFTAWTFLCTAIIAVVHAVSILLNRNGGHGSMRRSIWHDSFLFIPVLVWPVLFLAISIYNFTL